MCLGGTRQEFDLNCCNESISHRWYHVDYFVSCSCLFSIEIPLLQIALVHFGIVAVSLAASAYSPIFHTVSKTTCKQQKIESPRKMYLQSIAVAFEHCVLRGLSRKLCSANMTLTQSVCMASKLMRIQGRAISVKLHPLPHMVTQCAMFKRNCNRL